MTDEISPLPLTAHIGSQCWDRGALLGKRFWVDIEQAVAAAPPPPPAVVVAVEVIVLVVGKI